MITIHDVLKILAPIKRRVALMIARAVVDSLDNDKKTMRIKAMVLDGETIDDVEWFHDYGFASYPKEGSEALLLFINGDRGHGIAAKVHDREYRPSDLEEGDVCIHRDEDGIRIWLKEDKKIYIEADELEIEIDGDVKLTCKNATVEASEDVKVTCKNGEIEADEQVKIKGSNKIIIESDSEVSLGGEGGQGVARIGDTVTEGIITGGSMKVKAT